MDIFEKTKERKAKNNVEDGATKGNK